MAQSGVPHITHMSKALSKALLKSNHVGRIAYAKRSEVFIEPIHYVYRAGWIYCRTSAGSKLETLRHHPWVAFEVDEIQALFEWKSVVARGTAYISREDGSESEQRAFRRGVSALRGLVPDTLRSGDPTPFRTFVFGIYVHELTGRQATMRRATGKQD